MRRPCGEQAEAVIEVFGEAAQPEDADAAGRQFDGERDAVEPAADVDDQRRVGVVHLEPVVARRRRARRRAARPGIASPPPP